MGVIFPASLDNEEALWLAPNHPNYYGQKFSSGLLIPHGDSQVWLGSGPLVLSEVHVPGVLFLLLFNQLRLMLCAPMDCSMPGFSVLYHLPELVQTHVTDLVMPSNQLILCRPLLLSSSIGVFANE